MWHNNILQVIGNTPMVRLNRVTRTVRPTLLAKLEYLNPGGSVKDRIGVAMLEEAEKSGQIRPGGTVIEGTSGNTGMGLALARRNVVPWALEKSRGCEAMRWTSACLVIAQNGASPGGSNRATGASARNRVQTSWG